MITLARATRVVNQDFPRLQKRVSECEGVIQRRNRRIEELERENETLTASLLEATRNAAEVKTLNTQQMERHTQACADETRQAYRYAEEREKQARSEMDEARQEAQRKVAKAQEEARKAAVEAEEKVARRCTDYEKLHEEVKGLREKRNALEDENRKLEAWNLEAIEARLSASKDAEQARRALQLASSARIKLEQEGSQKDEEIRALRNQIAGTKQLTKDQVDHFNSLVKEKVEAGASAKEIERTRQDREKEKERANAAEKELANVRRLLSESEAEHKRALSESEAEHKRALERARLDAEENRTLLQQQHQQMGQQQHQQIGQLEQMHKQSQDKLAEANRKLVERARRTMCTIS